MQSEGRTKLFLENFLVYGLGGMISRFIPMIMLPIITRLYPSSEYIGLNDLSQTFISFAQALAVCGMYDAMFRAFFDYKELNDQKKVCSTALGFVACTTIVLSTICYIFRKNIAGFYFGDVKYEPLVIITIIGFLLSSTNQIVSAPTRIQNKRKVFLVTNTVSPVISYSIAIQLILRGHYILAIPLATILAVATVEVSFIIMNRGYFSFKSFDTTKIKELLVIGLPLLPNFLIYWVYNSADKVMISQILGNEATGVYSVASRIGHISNLIYTAFAGGWQYFAFSTMNDDDQVQMKSNIYEYLGVISFAASVMLMAVSKIGFQILFPEQYLGGFIVAPYLFLSPLLLMLYQVIANQFTIVKKTYMNLLSLSFGAIVNIILNYCLIHIIGIEGASIATLTGYIISNMLCLFWLRKMQLIVINKKVILNTVIIAVYFLLWRFLFCGYYMASLISAFVVELIYAYIYKNQLKMIINKIKKRGK